MKHSNIFYLSVSVLLLSTFQSPLSADSQFEKNMENAQKIDAEMEGDRQKENMRDKSHDFPRIKTGEDTSIGADPSKKEVNIRHTY
ncbi:hypothetical protein [Sedimenticola thiotaurini]|nr:hypothetical protein [Sedimenticola thiotaurini]